MFVTAGMTKLFPTVREWWSGIVSMPSMVISGLIGAWELIRILPVSIGGEGLFSIRFHASEREKTGVHRPVQSSPH